MENGYKRLLTVLLIILGGLIMTGIFDKSEGSERKVKKSLLNELNSSERYVILNKGTERPFTGKYNENKEKGTYICRQCNIPLFYSEDKFDSNCGWPSFDDEIPSAVRRIPDKDGRRTEIICGYCDGNLGHVFLGEGFTSKNLRHCVNSISMDFVPSDKPLTRERAFFAGGCFWGVEHLLESKEGVLDVRSGYMGGKVENPDYRQVSSGRSGHAETVEVIYDPTKISYEALAKLFFEIHDFTQLDRQGPDVGPQYRSEVFYVNESQKQVILKLFKLLKEKKYDVKTNLTEASTFYPAEDYHQDYYVKTGKTPYCHSYKKIFD